MEFRMVLYETRIFVKNLTSGCTEESIREFFGKNGSGKIPIFKKFKKKIQQKKNSKKKSKKSPKKKLKKK